MRTKPIIVLALFTLSATLSAPAATITVTTYADTTANDGRCSLREAIMAANNNTPSGAMPGECVAGGATLDTIVFSVAEFCQITGCTINLQIALPTIFSPVSIVGPGSGSLAVQRTAGNNRIFDVSTGNLATATSISGLTIRNGFLPDADGGAGVRNASSLLNLTNCTFVNNVTNGTAANRQGGGLLNVSGTVNVTNCTFTGCVARRGGGIFNSGTLTVTGSTFTGNTAGFANTNGQGGGIAAGSPATTTVTDCTFTNNFAGERGGAIITDATFTITRCSLTGNKSGGNGGGVSSFGAACNIVDSTIAGNQAGQVAGGGFTGNGGGIEHANGTLTVVNSTISGNTTDSAGGGIRNNAVLNLTNSTVTGNSTANPQFTQGGGIDSTPIGGMFPTFPFAHIKSSVVALNSSLSSPDFVGHVSTSGFNLVGKSDGSTGFTAATDLKGTIAAPLDPKLDPNGLQNNGGPTTTIALLSGSPAIDKGTSAGLTGNLASDQRGSGFPRTFDDSVVGNANGGDGTDIGAFEAQTGQPARLANISTRLRVETGDNVLIGGFIITGQQAKKLIVRAIGPSLTNFGLTGVLQNPTLELYAGPTLIAVNDNWKTQPDVDRQAVMDSGLPPTNDLESALVRSLPANGAGYTVIVRGSFNGTGIGLVEVYDLDPNADSELANISTRGFVQTGDNLLIAGTILVGSQPTKVILRAIGPSLANFGLTGVLQNPTLELVDAFGGRMSNDDWRATQEAEIIATGLAPTDNREAAMVVTLPAGAYTALVRGKDGTVGIALVEGYNLQ